MTCTPTELHFVTYVGVPTTLLGIIPLESQTLTLTHGDGFLQTAGWTAKDDASWLSELPCFGVVDSTSIKTQDVSICVNSDNLAAGTYTATVTFTITTAATKKIVVPVTLEVREPAVLGPLCIGLDKDLTKNLMKQAPFAATDEYSGITARLLADQQDGSMQALQMDGGSWNLSIQCGEQQGDGSIWLTGGSLTIEGVTTGIADGMIMPLSVLVGMAGTLPDALANADWGNTSAILFDTNDGMTYVAIVLADLPKVIALVPQLGGLLGGSSSATTTDSSANNQASTDMVIPLKPILNMLPSLMPVMIDLLSNDTVLALLDPILAAVPPVIIIMPFDTMMTLFSGMSS